MVSASSTICDSSAPSEACHQPLGTPERMRGARGEPIRQLQRLSHELIVTDDRVHEPPVQRLGRRERPIEQEQLHRALRADDPRQQEGRARIRRKPHRRCRRD